MIFKGLGSFTPLVGGIRAVLFLGLISGVPGSLFAGGNPELSYQINGVKYFPQGEKLLDEYAGEDYREETSGTNIRFYQGGTGTGRGILRAAEYLYLGETQTRADFVFESMGGNAAVRGILTGQLDWGILGRELLDLEKEEGLKITTVAYDSVFVAVPKDFAPEVLSITREDLAAVYVGEISNWKDLGGPDQPIAAIGFQELSGNFSLFRDLVLEPVYGDDARYRSDMKALLLDLDVVNGVKGTPGALGFGSYSSQIPQELEKVRLLQVDGEALTPETVVMGRYPLVRPLNFLTLGDPTGPARIFLDILLDQKVQQALKILKLESAE